MLRWTVKKTGNWPVGYQAAGRLTLGVANVGLYNKKGVMRVPVVCLIFHSSVVTMSQEYSLIK
jgi:hypothetical protein